MNTDPNTPFTDLLAPGEQIVATMAGAGAPLPNGARVWNQLALTQGPGPQRLLAVVLVQAPHGGAWQPVKRYARPSAEVRLARYPRTPRTAARLELDGLDEHLSILDIDDPGVFPYLEPFLASWAGRVEGAGEIAARQVEAPIQGAGPDPRLLLAVAGSMLLFVALCCGGSTFVSFLVSG